jgi:hypothetical protein
MLCIAILGHVLYRDVMTKQATTVGNMQSPTIPTIPSSIPLPLVYTYDFATILLLDGPLFLSL